MKKLNNDGHFSETSLKTNLRKLNLFSPLLKSEFI